MKTINNYNETVYFLNNKGKIESSTYAEYLCEFWSDQTTSPIGVEPRMYVAEIETCDTNDSGDEINHRTEWHVKSWGVGGRGRYPSGCADTLEIFDNEDEANLFVLNKWDNSFQNGGTNDPTAYWSKSEVEEMICENIADKIRHKTKVA